MIFTSRCYNGGKRHCFQPRYTEQAVEAGNDMATVWRSMHAGDGPKMYVCDVCVWCGAQIAPPGKGVKA